MNLINIHEPSNRLSMLGDAEDAQTVILRCQITSHGGAERLFCAHEQHFLH